MDSSPIPLFPSKLVDLLQSQHNSSSIGFDSSPIPLFGTQHAEDSNVVKDSPVQRKERRAWSKTDDEVLISSWLNTSKDAVVGNDQKSVAFWKRIADYFAASQKVAGLEKREQLHCKNRWHKINDHVSKFCGAYEAAARQKTSGQNENDILKHAHQIFQNNYGKKFTMEHAWKELRFDQKWCDLSTERISKKRKGEDGSQSSTSHATDEVTSEAVERPPGVKAAKRRGKKPMEEGIQREEVERIWSMKQEDLCRRERLSKLGLLDRLLAKPEPLTEGDEMLKKQLISDLFSA